MILTGESEKLLKNGDYALKDGVLSHPNTFFKHGYYIFGNCTVLLLRSPADADSARDLAVYK